MSQSLKHALYQKTAHGISERDYKSWRAERTKARRKRVPFNFTLLGWALWCSGPKEPSPEPQKGQGMAIETPFVELPPRGPETYLGDGLYVSHDGWSIWLRAPREGGDHLVALGPKEWAKLLEWERGGRMTASA